MVDASFVKTKTKLAQVLKLFENTYIQNTAITAMNAAFVSSFTVGPNSFRKTEFSPLEIQQGLLYGPEAFLPSIQSRYANRYTQHEILNIAKKATVALSIAATLLVSMTEQKIEDLKKTEIIDRQIEETKAKAEMAPDQLFEQYMKEAEINLEKQNKLKQGEINEENK